MLKKNSRTQRPPKLRVLKARRRPTQRSVTDVPYTPSSELEQLKRNIMH